MIPKLPKRGEAMIPAWQIVLLAVVLMLPAVAKADDSAPAGAEPEPRLHASPAVSLGVDERGIDALTWGHALQSNSVAGYREYLARFPEGRFSAMAHENIERLNRRRPGSGSEPRLMSEPLETLSTGLSE